MRMFRSRKITSTGIYETKFSFSTMRTMLQAEIPIIKLALAQLLSKGKLLLSPYSYTWFQVCR